MVFSKSKREKNTYPSAKYRSKGVTRNVRKVAQPSRNPSRWVSHPFG